MQLPGQKNDGGKLDSEIWVNQLTPERAEELRKAEDDLRAEDRARVDAFYGKRSAEPENEITEADRERLQRSIEEATAEDEEAEDSLEETVKDIEDDADAWLKAAKLRSAAVEAELRSVPTRAY